MLCELSCCAAALENEVKECFRPWYTKRRNFIHGCKSVPRGRALQPPSAASANSSPLQCLSTVLQPRCGRYL